MKTPPNPAEKFLAAMKQILSVSKEEVLRREDDYKKQRAAAKKKGP